MSFQEYKITVDKIFSETNNKKKEVIIIEDINAKSPQWGSPIVDLREEYWMESMAVRDLNICNDGTPTFIRGENKGHIDINCATPKIYQKIKNWSTHDDVIASHHKPITFTVDTKVNRPNQNARPGKIKKNLKRKRDKNKI